MIQNQQEKEKKKKNGFNAYVLIHGKRYSIALCHINVTNKGIHHGLPLCLAFLCTFDSPQSLFVVTSFRLLRISL